MNPDATVIAPLPTSPLEGQTIAIDAVHAKVIDQAPWAPAGPVLDTMDERCDLVLIAVPEGMGTRLATFLVHELHIAEVHA